MNSVWNLVIFEYKKILWKQRTLLMFLFALFITVFSCVGPLLGNYYVKGEVLESNYENMKKTRNEMRSLSGREINNDLLLETIDKYSAIPFTDGKYTDTDQYLASARPYSGVYYLIRRVYGLQNWREVGSLTKEDVNHFYSIRQSMVEESIGSTTMSPMEKEASIRESRQVKTPFVYSYTDGYTRFFSQMYTTAIIICFLSSICIAPLFSGEYMEGMDSLILSSKYGKNKVIYAKIFTGLSFSILLSTMLSILSYITVMSFFGWDGGNAPIQLYLPLSPHPFTMKEAVVLYFILILLGNLLSTVITMVLSAKLSSPFMVIVIMTVLTIIPMFVNISDNTLWAYHLFHLIPSAMFSFSNIIDIFYINLFGFVMRPYTLIASFAVILSVSLLPLVYRGFRNHN